MTKAKSETEKLAKQLSRILELTINDLQDRKPWYEWHKRRLSARWITD